MLVSDEIVPVVVALTDEIFALQITVHMISTDHGGVEGLIEKALGSVEQCRQLTNQLRIICDLPVIYE